MILIKKSLHIILMISMMILVGCGVSQSSPTPSTKDIPVIFDAISVSCVSPNHLIEELGEPEDIETWKNETSKGIFDMQIYCYSINNNYYEFLVADDSVVRMNIYSEKNWFNTGSNFSFAGMRKMDIPSMFGISPGPDIDVAADTGNALRLSPVSDSVSDFWIPMLDEENKTFELVKITYNSNYFD